MNDYAGNWNCVWNSGMGMELVSAMEMNMGMGIGMGLATGAWALQLGRPSELRSGYI